MSNQTEEQEVDPRCEWHKGDEPLDVECEPGCPNCGKMIEWKTCEGCHADFLDWSIRDFDDVISGPAVTSSGDFMCIPCARRHEAEEERALEEDAAYDADRECDPYTAIGESPFGLPGGGKTL